MIVYTLVFGLILKAEGERIRRLLDSLRRLPLHGLLPWTWFSASALESANVLMVNGNLIRRSSFRPKSCPLSPS